MEQFSIGADLESAAARRDESKRRDALTEFENFGRQTDGLRRVVSNDAVFDRDFSFHPSAPFRCEIIGAIERGQDAVEAAVSAGNRFGSAGDTRAPTVVII
jgi:hypothetical protein